MKQVVLVFLFFCSSAGLALAQDAIKVETLKKAPPDSLAAELHGALNGQGYRVQDEHGKEFVQIWLRQSAPASDKPSGPKGPIQFPFLADGEFLGALEFENEAHDYKDQPIAKGVYTMRYGLQPVNGDHLGVSTYRDYILLLPASKDRSLTAPTRKQLEERSAESAGTSHPAAFLLLLAPRGTKEDPRVHHDAEKDTWGVVLPLKVQVKGQGDSIVLPVQLVLVGVAA